MLTIPITAGRYTTAQGASKKLCTLMPTPAFYLQALWTVIRAASMAKKGIYTDGDWAKSSLSIIHALERCGCTFDIRGMETLCNNPQPCVFIANHMSTLETFILPTLIAPYQRVTFVVKKSLVEYPLFKHIMHSRRPVLVNRTNAREDLKAVLTQGVECLHNGISVVVFPQTTRATGFDPENFNTIGLKLAQRAGVPMVPIALKTDAWENGRHLKDFGRIVPERTIHVEFGPYIAADKLNKSAHTDIINFIQQRLNEWEQA